MGFVCSPEDRTELETTKQWNDDCTGVRRVVRFHNDARDTVVWYHLNSGLPDHVAEIAEMVGPYQGILCAGHWPHKTHLLFLVVIISIVISSVFVLRIFSILAILFILIF